MVQFIPGKSLCAICGKSIDTATEAIGFPAFVPTGHEFDKYSDSAFHLECFRLWQGHERFEKLYNDYQEIWKNRPSGLSFDQIEEWGKQAFGELFDDGMK